MKMSGNIFAVVKPYCPRLSRSLDAVILGEITAMIMCLNVWELEVPLGCGFSGILS